VVAHGSILALSAATTSELSAEPPEVVVLHGDVHHQNILDFGQRGWLGIDPKRLIGERGFGYANLFCNPDAKTATAAGRLARQVDGVAEAAGLERKRLLQWILAEAGLSAAWRLKDGESPKTELIVQSWQRWSWRRSESMLAETAGMASLYYIRSIYSPLSVLILIFSPCRTNGGTMTTSPVSILAGL
jgi:streptomycin 6-kinase